jgi:hypothetical protein
VTLPLLLSQRQAAKLLGVDRNTTLRRLIATGVVPLVLGKVPREALERVARGELTAPAPVPRRRVAPKPSSSVAAAIRALSV